MIRRWLRAGLAALALACLWAPATWSDEVGLAVGETAPTFTLVDQNGDEQSLDALAKRGKLAIVFFRSADW